MTSEGQIPTPCETRCKTPYGARAVPVTIARLKGSILSLGAGARRSIAVRRGANPAVRALAPGEIAYADFPRSDRHFENRRYVDRTPPLSRWGIDFREVGEYAEL